MKSNKVMMVIITILAIVMIAILGVLVFIILNNNEQAVSNQNVENPQQNNMPVSNIEEQNITDNEIAENVTLIEPDIHPSGTDTGTQASGTIDTFISHYYCNQLDDTAKTIYTELEANKDKFISGNYSVDFGTKFNTLLNTEGGQDKLTKSFQEAWDAFIYDNVDLFYIDVSKVNMNIEYQSLGGIRTYKVSIGPKNNASYYLDTFQTQEQVEQAKVYLEDIGSQMKQQVETQSAYNKIGMVHNWLIQKISYDENSANQHTVYGALVDNKAVCEGYARAFKYLMDASGIPCVLVSGTAKNSQGEMEKHAWNYVQINENWYAVDVTWDDPIIPEGSELTQELQYKYFLKGAKEFEVDHKEDGKLSENGKVFKFPTLSEKNYNP